MHEGRDGGATTHALCGVLVLDSESLGFARRYSPRSFDVLYLSSWVAQRTISIGKRVLTSRGGKDATPVE
ncbi:hypothetical protein M405DRAFT_821046 [Rhizopogon salebrosus TDB-379]|nr:hypothetical protein M405DRAFT_821046 [Rhizopogon salebrosus TDB-379]